MYGVMKSKIDVITILETQINKSMGKLIENMCYLLV